MTTRQYNVGEVVRMRPHGRGSYLWIKTPSGIEITAPSEGGGSVNLWIAEPGEWQARWELGELETFDAVVAVEEEPEEVENVVPLARPFTTNTP
jgi:hypothetical protein